MLRRPYILAKWLSCIGLFFHCVREFEDNTSDGEYDVDEVCVFVTLEVDPSTGCTAGGNQGRDQMGLRSLGLCDGLFFSGEEVVADWNEDGRFFFFCFFFRCGRGCGIFQG